MVAAAKLEDVHPVCSTVFLVQTGLPTFVSSTFAIFQLCTGGTAKQRGHTDAAKKCRGGNSNEEEESTKQNEAKQQMKWKANTRKEAKRRTAKHAKGMEQDG